MAVFYKSHAEKCMKFRVTVPVLCFIVWFCRALHIETAKLLRYGPSCRRSEQKGGCFVLRGCKKGSVRTKRGVFCAEESRGGAMTIVFCKKFGKDL